MKHIIVFVEDGKIIMTPEEFKKHMDDAYYRGYSDASSITTTYVNTSPWWEQVQCCDDTVTNAVDTSVKTAEADVCRGSKGE